MALADCWLKTGTLGILWTALTAGPMACSSAVDPPGEVGVHIERIERVRLARSAVYDSKKAVPDVLLLVVAGRSATRSLEIGETICGTWMLGRDAAHLMAWSTDGQKAVLAVADPGGDLKDCVLWFLDCRSVGAIADGQPPRGVRLGDVSTGTVNFRGHPKAIDSMAALAQLARSLLRASL